MTAVEWLVDKLDLNVFESDEEIADAINQAKEMDKEQMILLVEQLKDYTREAQCILGNDEREASEFVDIFLQQNNKSE